MAEFASYRAYQQFEESVRTRRRYISDSQQDAFLKAVLASSVTRREIIRSGSELWRAQLGYAMGKGDCEREEGPVEEPVPFPNERMKPLRDRAREGRANPKGIPYLYVATHRDTAMAEVRPWIGSLVSICTFELNRDVHVVNCVTHDSRLMAYQEGYEPEPQEREREVWQDIDRAFSRPVTSSDDTADYAPTQILAELFQANTLHGIAYGSSLGPGHNIVLFDRDVVGDTKHIELVRIESVKLGWSPY